MGELILHNSYPRQWRLILRGLTFLGLFLAVVLIALSIRLGMRGDELLPTYVIFVAFIPTYFVHVLRSAISKDGPDADDSAFVFTMLICAITLLVVGAMYFEHTKSIKQQARLQWAVSSVCSNGGEIRTDFRDECLRLMAQTENWLCTFGDTPMRACEAELRKKLDRPVG